MSLVNIINVEVLDNPAAATNPFQFEITFEGIAPLQEDLEWKVIYVGCAEDTAYDQVLEECLVGPIPVGINKFVLQAPPPDHSRIRNEDLIGVTVVLVTCSYLDQEFVRVGYYVSNEYSEPFDPETSYPNPVDISKLYRNILADQPRLTKFSINWSGNTAALPMEADPNDPEMVIDEEEEEVDFAVTESAGGEGTDEMDDEDDDEEEEEEEGDDAGEIELGDEDEEDEEDEEEEDEEYGEEYEGGVDGNAYLLNEDSVDVGMIQNQVSGFAHDFSNQGMY